MTTDISEATEHEICGHPCDDYILGIGCKCYDGRLDNDDDDEDYPAEAEDYYDWDNYEFEPEVCPFCGKDYEDFSDLGCGHCDRRHPGFIG